MKKFLFGLTMLIAVFHAGAPEALTLQEARDLALEANLNIKSYKERSTQAAESSKEDFAKLFAVLNLLGQSAWASEESATLISQGAYGTFPFGAIPQNDFKIIGEENNVTFSGAVQVQQPLFAGGRIWYTYKTSDSQKDEAHWNEEQAIQDTLRDIERAYLNLLKAMEQQNIAILNKKTMTAHFDDMEKRYKYGRSSMNDLLKVKVRLSQAERELIRANNEMSGAEGRVNLILNRQLETPVNAVHIGDPSPVILRRNEATAIALESNKALKSAGIKRETANYKTKVAKADYYPNINLTAQYNNQSGMPITRDNWWSALVTLQWPIWQWGGTKSKVTAAQAYERQTEYDYLNLENQTVAEVKNSYLLMEDADQRILVDKDAIKQADENLRITELGFNYGRNTSVDVMDAIELLTNARKLLSEDTCDAHLARVQFRYSMGKMDVPDFPNPSPIKQSQNEAVKK